MEYYLAITEGNPAICDHVDEIKGRFAKWNKPNRERETQLFICRIWKKKKRKKSNLKKQWMVVARGQEMREMRRGWSKGINFQL